MSNIIPFSFENHSVRTLVINDQPWFVAADVGAILKLSNVRASVALLDDDERGVNTIYTRSENGVEQGREVIVISESGLYALILRSRKPEAKRFRKWVTSEVLPSIRKTGAYSANPNQTIACCRWLWGIDHNGIEYLRPVPDGAIVTTIPGLLKEIAEPGGLMIKNDELIRLAFTALQRLVKRGAK